MDKNEIGSILAERMGKLMIARKESQQDVADAIGVKRETVRNWENGTRQIKAPDLVKLARHFEVSSDYLLGLSDVKSMDPTAQTACEYTGLTETSIELLHAVSIEHKFDESMPAIDYCFESPSFFELTNSIGRIGTGLLNLDALCNLVEKNHDTKHESLLIDTYGAIKTEKTIALESLDATLEELFEYKKDCARALEIIRKLGRQKAEATDEKEHP